MIAVQKKSWVAASESSQFSAVGRAVGDWSTSESGEESRKAPVPIHSGSRCVKGSYRETNEDRSYADVPNGVFLVVDGVGGYAGGSEASQVVLEEVPASLSDCLDSPAIDLELVQEAFEDGLAIARLRMADIARSNRAYRKMGATMAAGFVGGGNLYVAHVGDCRAYLARGGSIRRLTSDESLVQGLVDAGLLTAEQARDDPRRNIILNLIGPAKPSRDLVVRKVPLHPGDHLVLATDGLTGSVTDNEILETIHAHRCTQAIADDLVLAALRNGSHDNVSCVVTMLGTAPSTEDRME